MKINLILETQSSNPSAGGVGPGWGSGEGERFVGAFITVLVLFPKLYLEM